MKSGDPTKYSARSTKKTMKSLPTIKLTHVGPVYLYRDAVVQSIAGHAMLAGTRPLKCLKVWWAARTLVSKRYTRRTYAPW